MSREIEKKGAALVGTPPILVVHRAEWPEHHGLNLFKLKAYTFFGAGTPRRSLGHADQRRPAA